jgi:hypothetical protein
MVNVKLLVPPWQSRGASLGRLAVGRIEFGHPVNIGPRIRPVTSLGQVIAATATHTGSPSGGPARHQGDPARDARRAAIGPVILGRPKNSLNNCLRAWRQQIERSADSDHADKNHSLDRSQFALPDLSDSGATQGLHLHAVM